MKTEKDLLVLNKLAKIKEVVSFFVGSGYLLNEQERKKMVKIWNLVDELIENRNN